MSAASVRCGSAVRTASCSRSPGSGRRCARKGTDDVLHSCAIVTAEPNELIRPIHDRMPVILAPDREAAWLDPERPVDELLSLLVPAPTDALIAREVSDLVNDVREDGPRLIEPREEQGVSSRRGAGSGGRRRGAGTAAVALAGQRGPPMGRSSSTCHSWLKPIIATATRTSCTGTTTRVSRPSRSSGRAGEVRPVLVAREPVRRRDRGEDREDHRQRRGHGQDAARPAHDEEREEDVEAGPEQAHHGDARAPAAGPSRRA